MVVSLSPMILFPIFAIANVSPTSPGPFPDKDFTQFISWSEQNSDTLLRWSGGSHSPHFPVNENQLSSVQAHGKAGSISLLLSIKVPLGQSSFDAAKGLFLPGISKGLLRQADLTGSGLRLHVSGLACAWRLG